MIDSIGLFIPITKDMFNFLNKKSILTQRIDQSTGEVEFEYSNFQISHSWNYRVIWRLSVEHWVYDPVLKLTVFEKGSPYLRFEFSIPKILYGHNLYSCDWSDVFVACQKVRDNFNLLYEIKIPDIENWCCYRVDNCANFILSGIEEVKAYIRYLQRFDYPRRIKNNYSDTGIYFASRYYTLKVYCKGLEFKKHDAYRFVSEIERQKLQRFANTIIRIEVENKQSLRAMREKLEKIGQQFFENTYKGYLSLYDTILLFDGGSEMRRIMNKFLSGNETKIMKTLDVFRVLKNGLGNRSANFYYAIYMLLVTQGQNETKRQIKKATYYRALSLFRELGISIIASDVRKKDCYLDYGFPRDFTLEMSEKNKYYQQPMLKAA